MNRSNYYPNPDSFNFEFTEAEPFHYHIGESIVQRGSGLDTAERIGGLRRDTDEYRRIEIWLIPEEACLLRLRHLQNSFYFELTYNQLPDEIVHLIENEGWELDYVAADRLVAELPDEHLPGKDYDRAYFG